MRILGAGFGIAVLVGNTIGSGILRTPGEVAGHLHSLGLFFGAWIAGGLYALLGSNALAEVSAMTPESGGYTVFVRRGLGPYLGFVAGWSDWLSCCTSATAAAIVIGESVCAIAGISTASVSAIACAILFAFAILQWRGVRTASKTQNFTSILKAFAFVIFIGVCFAWAAPHGDPAPAQSAHEFSLFIACVLAMQAVIFTYDGWNGPAYFAGELRDPGRELPRSIFGGVIAVIVIYLLVNLALVHVIPMNRLAHDPFAVGTAMTVIFGAHADLVLRVFVILSLVSAINAYLMFTSRTFHSLSGQLKFSSVSRVNEKGTPTTGLLVSCALAALFALSGTYNRVIAITAFLFLANYTFLYATLFALRARESDATRPFRAWGHPWSTGLVLLVSICFAGGALVADTSNSLISLGLLAISYPIYRSLR